MSGSSFAALAERVQAAFPAVVARLSDNAQPWLEIPAADLTAVATLVRDDPALAFDSLMDLTGVDLLKYPATPPATAIAVVYLLHSLRLRHKLTLKVLAPRDACTVPSVSAVWPAANYFEREVFDLLGVTFTGHRRLVRIMCPDDWVGHPLRKDYVYPQGYNGVAHLRDGQHFDDVPAHAASPAAVAPVAAPGMALGGVGLAIESPAGERMRLNMGPHHPATHGVLRLIVESDGEVVDSCTPDHGYLHRSIEKIGECVEWPMFVPYTDRVDYVCAMNANLAYCVAVEKLLATDPAGSPAVPLRAECIRVLVAELNRISSHLVAVGAMAMDLGAYTPFLHGIAQREMVNDIFERLCGQRLTYNYVTIGGVAFDLHPGAAEEIGRFLDRFEPEMVRFNQLLTSNSIFRDRCAGIAAISAHDAVAYGLVGPNLRGSGVDWDLRRDEPYGIYGRLGVRVPVGAAFAGRTGVVGDCYDRYIVRLLELQESVRLCREVLKLLPPPADQASDPIGGYQADIAKQLRKPPKGEVHCRTEAPRGEMGYYLVSDGGKIPYRVRIRTGSFTACGIFHKVMHRIFLADIVAIIGSFDIVVPEIDR